LRSGVDGGRTLGAASCAGTQKKGPDLFDWALSAQDTPDRLADSDHGPREGDIASDAEGNQQTALPLIKLKVHTPFPDSFTTPVRES
jgi:hypothetical protein